MIRDAANPQQVERLLKVYQQRLSYRIVRAAEESKIALSEQQQVAAALSFVQPELGQTISQQQLAEAISQPLQRIQEQVSLALSTSHVTGCDLPDWRQRPLAVTACRLAAATARYPAGGWQ